MASLPITTSLPQTQHTHRATPSVCSCRAPPTAAAASQRQRAGPAYRRRSSRRLRCPAVQAAAVAADVDSPAAEEHEGSSLQAAKRQLLSVVAGTERGADAGSMQRGAVEEAQVAVESFSSGAELDWSLLAGRWLLQYTTASDVLPLVAPHRGQLPQLLKVGNIYQAFTGGTDGGIVQNIIEARVPPLLPGLPSDLEAGVALVVEAGWEVRTARSIALTFREAGFQDVTLSPSLQNLLASPLLPRGWWNQQLLMAIQQLSLRIPLTTRGVGTTSDQSLPVGINYMLTHLDEDMLIGRAQGNGGVFIFTREDQQPAEE